MQAWQRCFRDGFAPSLPTEGLRALAEALKADSPELCRRVTTCPPPVPELDSWPCEAADPVAYALWKGKGLSSVGEVEAAFAEACVDCDERLGEVGGCRYFIGPWDDGRVGRADLLTLVEELLAERAAAAA